MPIPNSGMDALKTIDQFASFETFLAGLVVFAERLNPIPSRTRPLNSPAPMVLSLKAWKSRSLPGLPRTIEQRLLHLDTMKDFRTAAILAAVFYCRADHNAAMRCLNAFGFSAKRRPATRCAVFRCAPRRAAISGARRD